VKLRPRICDVRSLLRIHSPDCKHCMAHLSCGTELRKRLEELNEPMQAVPFPSLRQGAEMGQFAPDQIVRPGGCVVTLRPRICHLLSLLRIHNPDCKHCAAHLTCGTELRKRLEELNEPMQPVPFPSLRQGVETVLALMPSERRKAG
jgi:RNase P subunit RPR2